MGVLIITHYQRILHHDQARPRLDHLRRAHRHRGRPRARRPARARGLREAPRGVRAPRAPRARGHVRLSLRRGGLPRPRAGGPRLPRQRGDVAEAAPGHRRDGGLHARTTTRRCTAASTRWRSRRRSASRARRTRAAQFVGAIAARDDPHRQRDAGDQPRRAGVGAGEPARRATASCVTEMEHHSVIVPWHMICRERGAHLDVVGVDDEGRLQLDELDALLARGPEARRRHARLERARHDQPDRGDRPPRARRRRARPRRRLAGRAADPRRRRRRSARTSTRGRATRPTARPASASCTAAASCSRRCRRSSAAGT